MEIRHDKMTTYEYGYSSNPWSQGSKYYGHNQIDKRPVKSQGESRLWKWTVESSKFFYLFMKTSSIHGFNHLTTKNRTPFEHVVWFIFVCLGIWGCVTVSLSTLRRYEDNPTVISMERDYKQWNTSLPSVTACPTTDYKIDAISKYVESNFSNFLQKVRLEVYLRNLTKVTYAQFKNLQQIPEDPVDPDDYLDLVYNVFQARDKFKKNITTSIDLPQIETVDSITERGLCYTFSTTVAMYNNYHYWKDNRWDLEPPTDLYYGNSLDGDRYAQWYINTNPRMYVHSAFEIPDVIKRGHVLKFKYQLTLRILALSIYSTEEVRTLRIKQRKCRFAHESNLKISPVYTYNLCRMQCRMEQAKKLCQCVPYFYRRVDKTTPVCDAQGMLCLGEKEEALVKLVDPKNHTRKINCGCYPPCDDVNYMVDEEETTPWDQSTAFKWGMSKFPKMRLKRDLLFGFTDLLVYIGGTAGLFLGCSVLSFMEIFYFFTLHLFWFVVKRRQPFKGSR